MLIIHGAYHFWPKRVGFRNDYCLGCQAPRRSIAWRSFDVGHIYWIPILPVGYWKHWKCSMCGRDPHQTVKTRRSFIWAGFVCLLVISWVVWAAPAEFDITFVRILRLVAPAGAIAVLLRLLLVPKDPSLKERLAAIPPAIDVACPFCMTSLVPDLGGRWSCPACGSVRS